MTKEMEEEEDRGTEDEAEERVTVGWRNLMEYLPIVRRSSTERMSDGMVLIYSYLLRPLWMVGRLVGLVPLAIYKKNKYER